MAADLERVAGSLVNGFQMACAGGPLCRDPMMGVAFIIDDFTLLPSSSSTSSSSDSSSAPLAASAGLSSLSLSGQLITVMRETCLKAFSQSSPRLMEAMYTVHVQTISDALGKLYGVLARRRGQVVDEQMKEGTPIFLVKAVMPVAESFGMADELRKKTSGAASPLAQLLFDHWRVIPQDPFWVPTTDEEIEEFGAEAGPNLARDIMNKIRTRKVGHCVLFMLCCVVLHPVRVCVE